MSSTYLRPMTWAEANQALGEDTYLVASRYSDFGFLEEAILYGASFDRTVEETFKGKYEGIITVTMINREKGICKCVDREIAEGLSALSYKRNKTPKLPEVRQYITDHGFDFAHDRDYLAELEDERLSAGCDRKWDERELMAAE